MVKVKICNNLTMLKNNLRTNFINNDEYNLLYSVYSEYLTISADFADFMLGEEMKSFYDERYSRLKTKAQEDIILNENGLTREEIRKKHREEFKRKMNMETIMRQEQRNNMDAFGNDQYTPSVELLISAYVR